MKSNNKFLKQMKVAAALATALALTIVTSAPVRADDYKLYPGSLCDNHDPADALSFSRYGGWITNISSRTLTIVCPIVRDTLTRPSGPIGLAPTASIEVYNSSSSYTRCTLQSNPVNAIVNDSIAYASDSYNGAGYKEFNMIVPWIERASLLIYCELPPGGSLLQYTVGEVS